MNKQSKRLFNLVFAILFSAVVVTAQESPAIPKHVSGGVLNGRATSLAKPVYPPAAKAVNAEGAVNVQVTIDESGNVISANATSGHPLLRDAAVQAARASKFEPTMLSGQAVKITGVIVYNFVSGAPAAANWFRIGRDLASLERIYSLRFFPAESIAEFIPSEWAAEKQQAQRLTEIKKSEAERTMQPEVRRETVETRTETKPDGTKVITRTEKIAVPALPGGASSEQAGIAQSLIGSLQGRLTTSEKNLWLFNTGVALTRALNNGRDKEARFRELSVFRQQLQNVPAGVLSDFVAELQKFVPILGKEAIDGNDMQQISEILGRISSFRLDN